MTKMLCCKFTIKVANLEGTSFFYKKLRIRVSTGVSYFSVLFWDSTFFIGS